jgi:uncharacterized membrane protein YedE/YeeE
MKSLIALISGVLFGIGLTISQMVNPQKVLNFLDVFGNWDPSLAFVMGGALGVFGIGYLLLIKPREKAVLGDAMPKVSGAGIDKPLLAGASLFGIGWGISGVCPGPAVANFSSLNPSMLVFILFMIVGLKIGSRARNSFGVSRSDACDI